MKQLFDCFWLHKIALQSCIFNLGLWQQLLEVHRPTKSQFAAFSYSCYETSSQQLDYWLHFRSCDQINTRGWKICSLLLLHFRENPFDLQVLLASLPKISHSSSLLAPVIDHSPPMPSDWVLSETVKTFRERLNLFTEANR